jgi:hypothetical protein
VDAPRGVQRSGTNGRGLSIIIAHDIGPTGSPHVHTNSRGSPEATASGGLGGAGGADPPVPIPNTVVKRPSADDTRRAAARDNRPVPGPSPLASSLQASTRVPLTDRGPLGYPIESRRRPGSSRNRGRGGRRVAARHVDNRRVVRREGEPFHILMRISWPSSRQEASSIPMESLILAQDKRWRRA